MKAFRQIIRRVAENPALALGARYVRSNGRIDYRKRGARLLIESHGEALGVLVAAVWKKKSLVYGQR